MVMVSGSFSIDGYAIVRFYHLDLFRSLDHWFYVLKTVIYIITLSFERQKTGVFFIDSVFFVYIYYICNSNLSGCEGNFFVSHSNKKNLSLIIVRQLHSKDRHAADDDGVMREST